MGGGIGWWITPLPLTLELGGSFHGLGGLKETKMFLPYPLGKLSIVGSLRDRELACSASDLQGSNFESCVWRTVSSHLPREVQLAQFTLYVQKSGLKPDSFHFSIPLLVEILVLATIEITMSYPNTHNTNIVILLLLYLHAKSLLAHFLSSDVRITPSRHEMLNGC